ncbi:diguanylate cyclase [Herbaspirillum hiltneri N3]|uniref:diguanylate cyclase n=2 Tax=Herbaspirillum TaxID=963 RepID=A0ABM5V040_9BURK|nr:diguanylate cyclase [Herbaspirillum hiltneri N3]
MTRQAPKQMEPDSAVYKTLLESTKAIPWKIDWATMKFAYVGPQIEALLGWAPESWVSVEDWAMRIHAEDREGVVNFCVAQSKAGVDHEADYRAITRDGEHVWIRDVVHVVRKPDGEVEALIGFMFDITERKKNEARLAELQKELEALSYRDGLTNVANRRMFDSALEVEWANAVRNRTPLSLFMIDIDYFKQYNDHYGHVEGDKALQLVANTLRAQMRRPTDICARYGGEEFVMLIPGFTEEQAERFAERLRTSVNDLAIAHAKSSVQEHMTISVGVCTMTPDQGSEGKTLLRIADSALYRAKKHGRNRIQSAS